MEAEQWAQAAVSGLGVWMLYRVYPAYIAVAWTSVRPLQTYVTELGNNSLSELHVCTAGSCNWDEQFYVTLSCINQTNYGN
jgi:hypothetical protein